MAKYVMALDAGCLLYTSFELNHMLHRLCGSPSIPLSFILANVLPRWITYCVCCGTEGVSPPTPSNHRLRRGLPGYLIPVSYTHLDVYKRQILYNTYRIYQKINKSRQKCT